MEPALLPSPGRPARFFDPRFCDQLGAATGCLELRQRCPIGITTERAALFGPFCLLRRNSSCRNVETPFGRQPGPGNPTLGKRIPPVPDLALPLHSTGAKP
jgi:hypothetical protein